MDHVKQRTQRHFPSIGATGAASKNVCGDAKGDWGESPENLMFIDFLYILWVLEGTCGVPPRASM